MAKLKLLPWSLEHLADDGHSFRNTVNSEVCAHFHKKTQYSVTTYISLRDTTYTGPFYDIWQFSENCPTE